MLDRAPPRLVIVAVAIWGVGLTSQTTIAAEIDYTALSIEELGKVPISSLGRKNQTLMDSPAAASIITPDDIARTGSTGFADALRFTPGIQAPRINNFDNAVSARGFNDFTSSKLLVLMDGRSVYNQVIAGANWGFQSVFLTDVNRIEILRGPAGSLWGANAMNGVINVVSKSAHDTLGSYLSTSYGDQTASTFAVRHGLRLNDSTALRVYAQVRSRDDDALPSDFNRGWHNSLTGVRSDWYLPNGGSLTAIGEMRRTTARNIVLLPIVVPPYVNLATSAVSVHSHNGLVRYVHPFAANDEFSIQTSYARESINHPMILSVNNVVDADLQWTLHPFTNHEVIAGLTVRANRDKLTSTEWVSFPEPSATTLFTGAFLQDEISLWSGQVRLTLGSKVEKNSYTGWEFQPNLRALWHPTARQSLWVAVSQAARVPSRAERNVRFVSGTYPPTAELPFPAVAIAQGTSTLGSEHVIAHELGYRTELAAGLTFDLALFHNRYSDLRGLVPGDITLEFTPAPHFEAVYLTANNVRGTSTGGELSIKWRAAPQWEWEASVDTLTYDLSSDPTLPPDDSIDGLVTSTPRWQSNLRGTWHPISRWSLSALLRHSTELLRKPVPAYTALDARVAWRVSESTEFEIVGRDLLKSAHAETTSTYINTTTAEIGRSWFAQVRYTF